MKQLDSTLLSGQHNWSNIFDLSEEEDEDNIEEHEDTPIVQSNQTPKEPLATLLRAFLNVLRFLLQQRGPNTDIQPEDVKRALYRGTEATEDQLKEVARIINFLRPFVPRRDDKNELSQINVFNGAAVVALANKVVLLFQPQQNPWMMFPNVEKDHSLHLGAAGLYIMSKTHILRYDGTPITDIKTATWHSKDVFWNFFDVHEIQILLQEQKLQPMWRLCYIDKYRIRVLGYKIPIGRSTQKSRSLYLEIQEEEEIIALIQNKLYHLNRQLKGQEAPLPCSNNLSGEGLVQELLYEQLQGQRNVGITDINRFEALQEDTDQIADIDTDVERCPKPIELKTGSKIQIHKYRREVRHTTCSRDAAAASNIALSGISRALSDDNQPLP
ncbi:hypothetical protein VTP01DRAFT_9854 [Rhizomucor pusillus]|uniref:uncharacterized protein n=1 Tax=Rhizomucor pusillus TaxID=4840 RepID=UPI00374433DF